MDSSSGFILLSASDGASQQQRIARALDSDPFALDERTLRELLGFGLAHVNILKFYNPDDRDKDAWTKLLKGGISIAQLDNYLKLPPPPSAPPSPYSRPHLAMLLTFLDQLRSSGVQMDTISRSQLDDYYQNAFDAWRKAGFIPPGRPEEPNLNSSLLRFAEDNAALFIRLKKMPPDGLLISSFKVKQGTNTLSVARYDQSAKKLFLPANTPAELGSEVSVEYDSNGVPETENLNVEYGPLNNFDPDNREAGDWSAYLDGKIDALIADLKAPAKQAPPHLILFLTFLALLQRAQVSMETITRNQLDDYYQKALNFRKTPGVEFLRFRDGTSQQQRISGTLDPDYFALDERSTRDLLEFSRQFAGTLKYFNRDNQEAGDWSAFLDGDLQEMADYLKDPTAFDDRPEQKNRYSQPHLALFLTFLSLLQRAQVQVNTITRRQLEFYYRQALGFRQKAGAPDQVHVLAQLEDEEDEILVPEGTLLFAGEDAAGEPVLYRTESELLANKAQLAQVKSLHVEKEVTNLYSIREINKDKSVLLPVFREVLNLAYRQPGTENTPRRYPNNQPADREFDDAIILSLDKVYAFITNKLQLRVAAFQYIIELYKAWENELNWKRADPQKGINEYLKIAGKKPVDHQFPDPRAFDANLNDALGFEVNNINGKPPVSATQRDGIFENLEGVTDLYDLYTRYLLMKNTGGELTDAEKAITDLGFSIANFEAMMKLRMDTLAYIRKIVQILGDAMPQPSPGFVHPMKDDPRFAILQGLERSRKLHLYYEKDNTLATLIRYIGRLSEADLTNLLPKVIPTPAPAFDDDFFSAIKINQPATAADNLRIAKQLADAENYFRMPAEDYFFIRQLFNDPAGVNWQFDTPAWKWRRADDLLKNAHRDTILRPDITAIPTPVPLAQLPAEPEITRWKNVYVAREAESIIVPGFDEKEEFPRWKTFGKKPDPATVPKEAELIETGEIGFVLATPALKLAEGKRELKLELRFEKSHFDKDMLPKFLGEIKTHLENVKTGRAKITTAADAAALAKITTEVERQQALARDKYPFSIAVSTEKKWVPIPDWTDFEILPPNDPNDPNNDPNTPKITITLLLNEEIAPLAPVDGDPCPSPWPALKLILNREEIEAPAPIPQTPLNNDDPPERRRPYELFRKVLLKSVKLSVTVTGLTQLEVQNHEGSIDPQKPFEPFGPEPRPGERLFIAHPELVGQRLDSLTLHLGWDSLPPNLATYYTPYTTLGVAFKISKLEAADFKPKLEVSIREAHRSLVLISTASDTLGSELKQTTIPDTLMPNAVPYERKLNPVIADNLPDSDRYLQIELKSPDFQHSRYAGLLAMTGANGGMTTEVLKVKSPTIRFVQLTETPDSTLTKTGFTVQHPPKTLEVSDYDLAKKLLILPNTTAVGSTVSVTYKLDTGAAKTETLTVKSGTHSIRFRGIPAENLSTDDFIVKRITDDTDVTVVYYDKTNKELTLNAPQLTATDTAVEVSYRTLLLPEPLTPVLNSIRADYTTSVYLELSAGRDTDTDHLLHLHPFGMNELEKSGEGEWVNEEVDENGQKKTVSKWYPRFLPRFDDEGQLFLGFENLRPPQTLSLLFQLAEGSSNPDLPKAKLEWACLAGEKWRVLGDEYVLGDTTNGLLNSGIIRLSVPGEASLRHSLMPAGLHWIRISVRRFGESLSDTIAIHTQAIRAVWVDPGAEALQEARTLLSGSIVEPYEPLPGLRELIQPFSSFFGKPAEQAPAFYRRVSERLRHKNRALTMWDYERLVLENFPDIYKVKALAADLMEAGAQPGAISVIVIPDIRFRRPFNPFEPKVQQGRLKEIQDFLQRLAPPFVQVQVQNPRFDYLHVRAMLRFFDMKNFDFYADRLRRELKQYLSPWAFDDAGEITFGRAINLSMLVYFMETRPYVDYIDKPVLTLRQRRLSDGVIETVQVGGAIQLRGPDVIFVSAPDHTIDFLDDTIDPAKRFNRGIGHDKIDLDFYIPKPPKGQ